MDYLFIILVNTSLIIILSNLAEKISLVDIPNNRKLHKRNIPLVGGLSIYLTLSIILFFFSRVNEYFYYYLITLSGLITFVGLLDDYKNINYKIRIFLIILISFLLIYFSNIYIKNIGNFFNLNITNLGNIGIIITLFCVFALVNAFNFLDGIDGLSAIQSLSILFLIYFYDYYFSLNNDMIIIYYLALSLLIFFIFNYFFNNKYKIFLGDAGSMFLGFMIAWICIFISQRNTSIPVALIPWILSYPVFDLISTVLIRISKRKSPFNPDHNHLHFILMKKLNLNKLNINLVILLITFVLNLIGFLLYVSITEEYIYLIYVFLFFLFHFYKLKYVN